MSEKKIFFVMKLSSVCRLNQFKEDFELVRVFVADFCKLIWNLIWTSFRMLPGNLHVKKDENIKPKADLQSTELVQIKKRISLKYIA